MFLHFYIMTRSIALSLLRQGNTGTEILSILDTLMSDESAEVSNNEPTADPIEFWLLTDRGVSYTSPLS